MAKRKKEAHANHERWLVSYADFITLLFAFFVVMFASSQVDSKKMARLAAYFDSYIREGKVQQQGVTSPGAQAVEIDPSELDKAALKALSMAELEPVKNKLQQELAPEIEQGKLGVALTARGLVLSLRESALFPPGSDVFTPEAVPLLGRIAEALRNLPGQPVRLEGHTDNVPIATSQFPSNWELSAARAMAVLALLTGRFQIEAERMAVAGYADFHPLDTNETTEGRARNRRVDIVVLSRSAAAMEPTRMVSQIGTPQPAELPTVKVPTGVTNP